MAMGTRALQWECDSAPPCWTSKTIAVLALRSSLNNHPFSRIVKYLLRYLVFDTSLEASNFPIIFNIHSTGISTLMHIPNLVFMSCFSTWWLLAVLQTLEMSTYTCVHPLSRLRHIAINSLLIHYTYVTIISLIWSSVHIYQVLVMAPSWPLRSCPLSFASNNFYQFGEHFQCIIKTRQYRNYMHLAASVPPVSCQYIYWTTRSWGILVAFVKAHAHSIN